MNIHPHGFVASLVLLLSVVRPLQAEVLFHIYAPSPDEKKVLVVQASKTEGGLSLQKVQDVEIGFPVSTITRHPSKPVLYVAPPSGAEGQARGALLGLKADGTAETPVSFNFQHPSAYLRVDRSQKFLMSADYGSGCVDVYSMDDAGLALKLASTTNEGRNLAHCIATTPDNQFAYVSYVKETNAIFQYRFDAASGKLSPLAPHNAEPPAGTGPRHMAFHPTKPILYFSNEQHLGVSAYNVHPNGQLSVRQIVDCLPKDQPKDGISSSDIVTTPDGKYLFAGIRGAETRCRRMHRPVDECSQSEHGFLVEAIQFASGSESQVIGGQGACLIEDNPTYFQQSEPQAGLTHENTFRTHA